MILQFRVLIRVLEPISVPNQSRDSFILIKLNTLSTGEEFVMDKVFNFILINESLTDSERKWALEPESKPEIEE